MELGEDFAPAVYSGLPLQSMFVGGLLVVDHGVCTGTASAQALPTCMAAYPVIGCGDEDCAGLCPEIWLDFQSQMTHVVVREMESLSIHSFLYLSFFPFLAE